MLIFFSLFGLFYPIVAGIYIHDVFIVICLFFYAIATKKNRNISFESSHIYIFIVFLWPFLIIALLDSLSSSTFNFNSYFLPFKVIWCALIVFSIHTFLSMGGASGKSLNIIVLTIILPIILSILMYFYSPIEQVLLSIYNKEKYPTAFRFGGVFGKDVNTLGMYSSLTIILSFILLSHKKIMIGLVVLSLSLTTIALSGMRTGILVLSFLMFMSIFIPSFRIGQRKKIIFTFTLIFMFILLVFINLSEPIQDVIIERFSVIKLISDVSYGESGNLTHASHYLKDTLRGLESSWLTPLIGYSSDLMFVDNMFVFLFLKYGVFSVFLYIFMFLYLYFKIRDELVRFLLLFSIIVSLKGIFVLGNYYIYLCFFIIFIHQSLVKESMRTINEKNIILR